MKVIGDFGASSQSFFACAMSYVGGRRYNAPLLLLWALFASLAVALSPAQVLIGDARLQQSNKNRRGAVASENKLCSQIGIDLLKAGGNAADAVSLLSKCQVLG